LEEHEDEHEQGQGPKLAIRRVLVAVQTLGREGHVLYQVAHQKHQGPDDSKLDADLGEDADPGLGWIERWGNFVQKYGHDESKDKTQHTDPRTPCSSHNW